jgi:hypothetical protein
MQFKLPGTRNVLALAATLLMVCLPLRAAADYDDPPDRVARLSYISGAVSFQPGGESRWVRAMLNRPITTGDRLWTDSDSRAELNIGSAAIRLDSYTGFSFLNLDDDAVQIELTEGTLNLRVRRLRNREVFEVDTPNQAFSIYRPGTYRIQTNESGASTIISVFDGFGESTGGGRAYTIESGRRVVLSGTDRLYARLTGFGGRDDFDSWSASRDRRYESSRSARYVSPELVGYEDLDDYGGWVVEAGYGNVWVPRGVPSGWAPYRDGHWSWISPWGWTWVDDAPWGYAPFHYGRWAFVRERWCWVPGPVAVTPVYAPALVAFVGGPRFGVSIGFGSTVGWFPLGPREVYVPGYRVSRDYVTRVNVSNTVVNTTTITNIYNTQISNNTTNVTQINYTNRAVPGAVTAVPQRTFTSAEPVARAAIAVNPQQAAAAPVTTRAEVAPTQNSVVGTAPPAAKTPPPAVAERQVVVKTAPPPPPVPFAVQQQELEVHPGQPLAKREAEGLRPGRGPEARQLVKQAPPATPVAPSTAPAPNEPAATPPAAIRPNQPGAPQPPAGNQPNPQPSGQPPISRPNEKRNERAPEAPPPTEIRPNAAPPPPEERRIPPGRANEVTPRSEPPAAQPVQPPTPQPPQAQPNERRNNRPQEVQPPVDNRPNAAPPPAPPSPEERRTPPGRANEVTPRSEPPAAQPVQPPTPPPPEERRGNPRNDRPPAAAEPNLAPSPPPGRRNPPPEPPVSTPPPPTPPPPPPARNEPPPAPPEGRGNPRREAPPAADQGAQPNQDKKDNKGRDKKDQQ